MGYFHELTPLDELVSSLLSHRTRNSESGAAYKELRKRFFRLDGRARTRQRRKWRDAIRACNWPEQKSPAHSADPAAHHGKSGEGELTLDFSGKHGRCGEGAWTGWKQLSGIGPKNEARRSIFFKPHSRPCLAGGTVITTAWPNVSASSR